MYNIAKNFNLKLQDKVNYKIKRMLNSLEGQLYGCSRYDRVCKLNPKHQQELFAKSNFQEYDEWLKYLKSKQSH